MNNEVIDAFSEYQRSQRLSETTIRNRGSILRTFTRKTGVNLLDATLPVLRRYQGRQDVSPGTARAIRGTLQAFYTFAVEDGYLDESPAERLPVVKAPKGEPRPFSRNQIEAMLNSGAYRRTRVMILLGYFQGFRVSQIARVRGDDIDLVTGTIRTVSKGGKEARLPLHPVIADLAPTMPRDWWFPSHARPGEAISGHSVTEAVTNAKDRAGIVDPRLTPHSLRHAYATDLVDAGVDILTVQKLMLHENLSTTQIYADVSEKRKRAALENITAIEVPDRSHRRAA